MNPPDFKSAIDILEVVVNKIVMGEFDTLKRELRGRFKIAERDLNRLWNLYGPHLRLWEIPGGKIDADKAMEDWNTFVTVHLQPIARKLKDLEDLTGKHFAFKGGDWSSPGYWGSIRDMFHTFTSLEDQMNRF